MKSCIGICNDGLNLTTPKAFHDRLEGICNIVTEPVPTYFYTPETELHSILHSSSFPNKHRAVFLSIGKKDDDHLTQELMGMKEFFNKRLTKVSEN